MWILCGCKGGVWILCRWHEEKEGVWCVDVGWVRVGMGMGIRGDVHVGLGEENKGKEKEEDRKENEEELEKKDRCALPGNK